MIINLCFKIGFKISSVNFHQCFKVVCWLKIDPPSTNFGHLALLLLPERKLSLFGPRGQCSWWYKGFYAHKLRLTPPAAALSQCYIRLMTVSYGGSIITLISYVAASGVSCSLRTQIFYDINYRSLWIERSIFKREGSNPACLNDFFLPLVPGGTCGQ